MKRNPKHAQITMKGETMPRYLTDEDVYTILTAVYHHHTDIQHKALRDAINSVPTANVVERKRGKWIPRSDVPNAYTCSNCYQVIFSKNRKYLAEYHAFCRKCGADMREESDNG